MSAADMPCAAATAGRTPSLPCPMMAMRDRLPARSAAARKPAFTASAARLYTADSSGRMSAIVSLFSRSRAAGTAEAIGRTVCGAGAGARVTVGGGGAGAGDAAAPAGGKDGGAGDVAGGRGGLAVAAGARAPDNGGADEHAATSMTSSSAASVRGIACGAPEPGGEIGTALRKKLRGKLWIMDETSTDRTMTRGEPLPALGRTLYVVATPIGNLRDVTLRALDVLAQVDVVAAEDTRVSAVLLAHHGIRAELMSLNEHNEQRRAAQVVALLDAGKRVALVTDAGTPGISDPGARLVRAVRDAGFDVVPVPGPSAVAAALSASGIDAARWMFCGFLPASAAARSREIASLATLPCALVFYEAPHRIVATVEALAQALGADRELVIARELTKRFESIHPLRSRDASAWIAEDPNRQRGEFVLIVGAPPVTSGEDEGKHDDTLTLLLAELPLARAVKLAAALTRAPKNRLYERALALQSAIRRAGQASVSMNRPMAASVASGWSRCGEWPQSSSTTRSTRPGTRASIASSCASVPYSSSRPWISSRGHSMPGSDDSMFQLRNAGASQMSFHPRNAESTSAWWRARRARKSVCSYCARARSIDAIESGSTNTCGASATTPRTLLCAGRVAAPAWMSAIDAPSLCPMSTGLSMARMSSSAGSTDIASTCM